MTHENVTEEQMERGLKAAFPAQEPSPQLTARIAELAARQPTRQARPSRQMRWKLATALGAVVIAIAVFQATRPPLAAAAMLRHMDSVMRDARSAHMVRSQILPNGQSVKVGEMWYQDGDWRMEDADTQQRVQVYAHGRLWTYEPTTNTVTVQSKSSPFAYNSDGFSVSTMLGSGAFGTPGPTVQQLGDTTINGRRARQVAVVTPMNERMVFSADPDTDLPFRIEAQRPTPRGWETGIVMDLSYNQSLPQSLFVPDFPRTAKAIDIDAGAGRLRWQWTRGISEQRAGSRRIVIRDVQVNTKGDVFLLYTAGHYPNDYQGDVSVRLSDDVGSNYNRQQEFSPNGVGTDRGFVFGGEKLEGICLSPDQLKGQAHRLKITFACSDPPRHGTMQPHSLIPLNKSAVFSLPVPNPRPRVVPDYMTYMAMPVTEQLLEGARGPR